MAKRKSKSKPTTSEVKPGEAADKGSLKKPSSPTTSEVKPSKEKSTGISRISGNDPRFGRRI